MAQGPLIEKYLQALEENPRSRVFAPLAESYRRLGMHDRAIEILKDGMRYHPNYVAGYLGLSACYFDLGQYQLCYATLKPFVPNARDNLRLQRLFANACEQVGHDHEALETYKFLLFLNPRDKEAAAKVEELEGELSEPDTSFESDKAGLFPVEEINALDEVKESSWVEVSFHQDIAPSSPEQGPEEDSWEMVAGGHLGPEVQAPVQSEEAKPSSDEQDDEREYIVTAGKEAVLTQSEVQLEDDTAAAAAAEDEASAVPLITHTLVDLYCNQGHFERAEEILLKMLALNPADSATLEKLQTVRLLLREAGLSEGEEESSGPAQQLEVSEDDTAEDDGRDILMQVFDAKIAKKKEASFASERTVENLHNFLDRIKTRAQQRSPATTRS